MRAGLPFVDVLGLPVARLDRAAACGEVDRLLADPAPSSLVYINAHAANVAQHDAEFRAVVRGADLVLNDGSGIAIAARLRGSPFPENLNGTDFNPRVLELTARRGLSVFLLGGHPGVAEQAAEQLTRSIPGLRVAGCHHGHLGPDGEGAAVDAVAGSGADVLLVAMGNPAQERFLGRHLARTGARLGIGVGGFFDFTSGRSARAPRWMRRLGIEWVFRLFLEPRRLFHRYVVGNPLFLARALRAALRSRRGPATTAAPHP